MGIDRMADSQFVGLEFLRKISLRNSLQLEESAPHLKKEERQFSHYELLASRTIIRFPLEFVLQDLREQS
jgi:hypothetical protein